MTQLEHLKAGVIRISRTKTDLTIGGVCTCLLVLGVISTVAIFTCITQLVPGDSSFDKVKAAPCRAIAWAATLEGCTPTACTATAATPVAHNVNVTLNTTDVKEKFDYIVRSLSLLVERSDDQEDYQRELRDFMKRTGEKLSENTEATKKSVKTHESAAKKAENATAVAKDRLSSYNMGTFFSVLTVSAGAYSKSANIFDVARVLLPYTVCHFGVLYLSSWLEFGIIVCCLCIFAVAGTWMYHSDKGQEQITIMTDTAHTQRPTHYVAPPPYYPTSPMPTSIPTPRVLLGASEHTHVPAQEDESNATPPGGAVQESSACMQRMARRAASSAHSA